RGPHAAEHHRGGRAARARRGAPGGGRGHRPDEADARAAPAGAPGRDARRAEQDMSPDETLEASSILVIDDEPANTVLLDGLLREAGYSRLQTTTDPRQAMELYQTARPDLILLDLLMPHLDGIQVMEQ